MAQLEIPAGKDFIVTVHIEKDGGDGFHPSQLVFRSADHQVVLETKLLTTLLNGVLNANGDYKIYQYKVMSDSSNLFNRGLDYEMRVYTQFDQNTIGVAVFKNFIKIIDEEN